MKKKYIIVCALLGFLFVACPIVDVKVVDGFREFFPAATCFHPTPDTLFLETHLTGAVSKELGKQLFETFAARPQFNQLKEGFDTAQYNWLCIGLADTVVVWSKNNEQQFWVLSRQEYSIPGWWNLVPPYLIGSRSISGSHQPKVNAVEQIAGIISKKHQSPDQDGSPQLQDRVSGRVQMIDKGTSTITLRKGNLDRWVVYNSDTKFTRQNMPSSVDELKEGQRVICLGKFDEKTRLAAMRVDIREDK